MKKNICVLFREKKSVALSKPQNHINNDVQDNKASNSGCTPFTFYATPGTRHLRLAHIIRFSNNCETRCHPHHRFAVVTLGCIRRGSWYRVCSEMSISVSRPDSDFWPDNLSPSSGADCDESADTCSGCKDWLSATGLFNATVISKRGYNKMENDDYESNESSSLKSALPL